jgi:hypothetical protein
MCLAALLDVCAKQCLGVLFGVCRHLMKLINGNYTKAVGFFEVAEYLAKRCFG